MIAHLRGQLAAKATNQAVIDVGGVGYLVTASQRTLDAIGDLGGDITLLTEMVVREDSMTLFGFASVQEKDTFTLVANRPRCGREGSDRYLVSAVTS